MHISFLNFVLPRIESGGVWAYWVVLLVSLLESLAFVGLAIPGGSIIIFVGFLASRRILDLGDLVWFVAIGAALGDGISFYLGKKGIKFWRRPDRLGKAQEFFKKYGSKSIFFGRFIGLIRPVIPFVAGAAGMDGKKFFAWNVTSAFGFAAAFLILGYFAGGAGRLVEKWLTIGEYTIILTVALLAVFFARRWFTSKKC